MTTIKNTTINSTIISLALHACVVVLGSMAIYKTPMKSLELSGGGGRGVIALSSVSFNQRTQSVSSRASSVTKVATTTIGQSEKKTSASIKTTSTDQSSISSVSTSTNPSAVTSSVAGSSSSTGMGSGTGTGSGHDLDQGKLFSQIKIFFENRLGSTLNINVEQLIKIKVTLGSDGEILSADLVQGKLEFQALKKVLNVAKNIPMKNYWKSSAPFPQEMIIPLILSPG